MVSIFQGCMHFSLRTDNNAFNALRSSVKCSKTSEHTTTSNFSLRDKACKSPLRRFPQVRYFSDSYCLSDIFAIYVHANNFLVRNQEVEAASDVEKLFSVGIIAISAILLQHIKCQMAYSWSMFSQKTLF